MIKRIAGPRPTLMRTAQRFATKTTGRDLELACALLARVTR